MEIEEILLWYSRLSLVFWLGVLAWAVWTLVKRRKEDEEFFKSYKPTLESGLAEYEVGSYVTLSALEETQAEFNAKRARKKTG